MICAGKSKVLVNMRTDLCVKLSARSVDEKSFAIDSMIPSTRSKIMLRTLLGDARCMTS